MYVIGRNDYGQYSQETYKSILCNRSRKKKKDILTMALTEGTNRINGRRRRKCIYRGYNGQGQLGNGTYESLTSKICISNTKVVVNQI